MDLEAIKSLKKDKESLYDCVKKFEKFLSKNPGYYKYGLGFNLDSRMHNTSVHWIVLDSWIGNTFGIHTYLSAVNNSQLFWDYFDEYVNLHKAEILNFISEKFNEEILKQSNHIKQEIQNLEALLKETEN